MSGPNNFSGPVERLFIDLYLVATGLHAVHLTIGISLLLGLSWRLCRNPLGRSAAASMVTIKGLYWHLVDIVWIFLFAALYLVRWHDARTLGNSSSSGSGCCACSL